VPPAEETQRRLAEEDEGSKEWCLAAGFNPEQLKVGRYTHAYIHIHFGGTIDGGVDMV